MNTPVQALRSRAFSRTGSTTRNRARPGGQAASTAGWLALSALAALVVLPLLYIFNTALKSNGSFLNAPFTPTLHPTLSQLSQAWHLAGMPGSLYNSLLTSIPAAILLWIVCGMAAFAVVHVRFKGRNAMLIIILMSILVPIQTVLFPLFVELRNMSLLNTYQGLILCFVTFGIPLTTFQFAAYFHAIPTSLIEAAKIDGANTFQILWRIIVPMSKPVLAVTGIVNVVWTWNDLFLPYTVISSSSKMPMTAQLAILSNQQFADSVPLLAAAAVLGVAPILVIYLFAQRQIISGLAAGGVK